MSLTPIERYDQTVKNNPDIADDESQRHALSHLQRVYIQLIAHHTKHSVSWSLFKKHQSVRGVYLWGGVGRGKTYLMDLFEESIPFKEKKRIHFYRFMQTIHESLKQYPKQSDPLKLVAKAFAKDTILLCLDEFMVNDIADAMILSALLTHLFAEGVTLVTTSNIPPDQLYLEGLQRRAFLPTIALLEKQTEVVNVDQGKDYRTLSELSNTFYYTPLKGQEDFMRAHMQLLSANARGEPSSIKLQGRKVEVVAYTKKVVWLEFAIICGDGRANSDYSYLADRFETVLISNIPHMSERDDDHARRFIGLIDTLYDARVQVVASAEVPIDVLYTGTRLSFEFQRTASRLNEMQKGKY